MINIKKKQQQHFCLALEKIFNQKKESSVSKKAKLDALCFLHNFYFCFFPYLKVYNVVGFLKVALKCLFFGFLLL